MLEMGASRGVADGGRGKAAAASCEFEHADMNESPDAVTGATWAGEAGEGVDAATGATWSGHQIEIASDRDDRKAEKPASSFDDEVQEVIDAVTGATWGTRNRIMEDMFHKRLDQDASSVPLFAPPGEFL